MQQAQIYEALQDYHKTTTQANIAGVRAMLSFRLLDVTLDQQLGFKP